MKLIIMILNLYELSEIKPKGFRKGNKCIKYIRTYYFGKSKLIVNLIESFPTNYYYYMNTYEHAFKIKYGSQEDNTNFESNIKSNIFRWNKKFIFNIKSSIIIRNKRPVIFIIFNIFI